MSFEWSNGGGVSQMWQPRWSNCHHIARDAQCTKGRLFLLKAIQSVAARVSRLFSRAWAETNSAAAKWKPAAKCGQN